MKRLLQSSLLSRWSFRLDVPTLQAGLNFTLTTDLGELDLLGEVAGGGSCGDLLADSM